MERLTYMVVRALWWGMTVLPLRLVMAFGRAAGAFAWLLAPGYRRLVRRNLDIAFGEELSDRQKQKIGREHFSRLAANFAAGACLSNASVDEIWARIDIEGLDHLETALSSGRGLAMAIGHIGNWELLARISPKLFGRACGTVYQRLTNEHVDAWVRRQRATEGLALFDRKEGFLSAIEMLRKGGAVGVLGDQHAGDGGLWCPFFGRLASTTPVLATMAVRADAHVMALALYSAPRGRWRLVIRPQLQLKSRDIAAVTAQINGELEQLIRADPADWLWSHNRWKTPKPRFLAIGSKRGIFLEGRTKPFRVLVRSVNWLGDAVMCAPAVRAIRRGRPDLELSVACPAKLTAFWESVEGVDRVLSIPEGAGIRGAASLFREHAFDVAILFPNSLRVGLEAWSAGIPMRVGYSGHFRRKFLTLVFEKPPRSVDPARRHQVHHYLELVRRIGAPEPQDIDLSPVRPRIEEAGTARAWRIAVCGGAEYGPAKRWPPERFAEVMRLVSESRPVEWTLVGVAKDTPVGAQIEAGTAGLDVQNMIGRTGLAELIGLLRDRDLLLTNDTGTMHLAASLGVPVVAIFGSTDAILTGPLGAGHHVVQHPVPCAPCFRRECNRDFGCMLGVEAAQVARTVEQSLELAVAGEKGSIRRPE